MQIYHQRETEESEEDGRICFKCKKYLIRGTARMFDIFKPSSNEPFLSVFICSRKSCKEVIDHLFPLCRSCGKRYLRKFTIPDKNDINEEERLCISCKP